MPTSTKPPSTLSNTSPPCAPTTPTPTPTWQSSKSPGSATTTPSRISPRLSPFCPAIPALSTIAPSSNATPARSRKPSPIFRPCSPNIRWPKTASANSASPTTRQHDYPAARDEYEKLQAIDPDDLAAHYQLAILYRRLGEKQKAAIESAKFADQKDDPTASTYALEFLRKHPEVASESVVWHTHDLTGDPVKQPAKIEYHYIPGAGL